MKNTCAINDVCEQLIQACKSMTMLGSGIEQFEQHENAMVVDNYNNMRFDELEHIQCLTLLLTDLMTQTIPDDKPADVANADGSVFGPGDLNAVKADPIEPADENRVEEE